MASTPKAPSARLSVIAFLRLSVLAALVTIGLKTAAWWLTGSVGLLSDAMESFVNLAAALFALAMVTIARSPPDDDHPFGHDKAEYFSSGFEGLLILGASLAILWAAAHRWSEPQPLEDIGIGVALSVVSSLVNGGLAWAMLRAARAHESIALEADARHLMTDVWTSVGVALGLLLVPVTGLLWLDPLLAALVALNILREAWGLVRRSVDGLMDRALNDADRARIDAALQALHVGDVRFDHIRTRRAGGAKFVQLHMHVPAHWTLREALARRDDVERRLVESVRALSVTIELLPAGHEPISLRAP